MAQHATQLSRAFGRDVAVGKPFAERAMSDNSWYVDFLARTLGWWAALSPVALQHVCAEVARAEGSEMNLTGGHANAGRTVSNNNSVFLSLELR